MNDPATNDSPAPSMPTGKKRSLWLRVVLALVILMAVFVLIVSLQPSEFSISRSATIDAPPAQVFPHVNDLHAWEAWSPWARLDPNAKNTFEGPPAGAGAKFSWDGNQEVGVGSMTISQSKPDELVQIKLDFVEPFPCSNDVEFTFHPEGNQTRVTWTMTGKNNFVGKALGLVMNMDKMVGSMFEQGLANLKTVVEERPVAG